MTDQPDLIALLTAVKEDEEQAFARLSLQFKPLIDRSVGYFSRNPIFSRADYEDLRQEAMLALYKAAKSYDLSRTQVTFGLYAKICINNRLVSAKRKKERRLQRDQRPVGRPAKRPAPAREQQKRKEKLPTEEELLLLMEYAQKSLTPFEKTVFDLYLCGMSYKEIAKQCDCEVKAVDNALTRAKRKLKAHVRDSEKQTV